MPGFDGTGPLGQGPLTGTGRGYCVVPLDSKRRALLKSHSKRKPTVIPGPRLYYSSRLGKRPAGMRTGNIRRDIGRKF